MENEYIDGYIFGPNDLSGSISDFLNVYDEKTTKLMNKNNDYSLDLTNMCFIN